MMRGHSTKLHYFGFGCLIGYLAGRQSLSPVSVDLTSPFIGRQASSSISSPATQRQTDLIGKSVWDVLPFEHSPHVNFQNNKTTDAYNPFYNYLFELGKDQSPAPEFPTLPLFHSWFHFFEAYHNHMHRFRKQEKVVFMEIGVQSGGKIALLKDYFGPSLEYIGVDINPSTKMFQGPNVHIEIGDSGDRTFLQTLQKKYPHIDIFLDDGGHTLSLIHI